MSQGIGGVGAVNDILSFQFGQRASHQAVATTPSSNPPIFAANAHATDGGGAEFHSSMQSRVRTAHY